MQKKLQVEAINQLMRVMRATHDNPLSLHPAALQNSSTGTKQDVSFYCWLVSSK